MCMIPTWTICLSCCFIRSTGDLFFDFLIFRLGNNGILSSSVESLSPLKSFPSLTAVPTRRLTENLDPARRNSCCPQCMQNYEEDLAKILPKDFEKSSEVKSEPTQPSLPLWLKNAKSQDGDLKTSDQTVVSPLWISTSTHYQLFLLELKKLEWNCRCVITFLWLCIFAD